MEKKVHSVVMAFSNPYLFIGSNLHDSYLYRMTVYSQEQEQIQQPDQGQLVKKRKVLYQRTRLDLLQELKGISGGISSYLINRQRSDGVTVSQLLLCSGFGHNSFISICSLSINPYIFQELDEQTFPWIQEIERIMTIAGTENDLYILLSRPEGTTVLSIEGSIEDITGSCQFFTEEETIGVGKIGPFVIYQASSNQLNLMNLQAKSFHKEHLEEITKIENQGKYFVVLYKNGTVEGFKMIESVKIKLWLIQDQWVSLSHFRIQGLKVVVLGKIQGNLQFFNLKTGQSVGKCSSVLQGPTILSQDQNINQTITDPSSKITVVKYPHNTFLIQILFFAQNNFIIFLARSNQGQIFIYRSFQYFKFQRVTSNLYLGPSQNFLNCNQCFFSFPHCIFVTHSSGNFWIFPNSHKRTLYIHPNINNGVVFNISSFNHPDCPQGFIFRQNNLLKIGFIQDIYKDSLKQSLLMARTPCLETPRQVIANLPYIVCSFFSDQGSIHYSIKVYLFSQDTGLKEVFQSNQFTANQIVLAMCFVTFHRNLEPPYDYLAIGTGMIGTQDCTSQGRLILYAFHNNLISFQPLHKKPGLKGAISALACIDGYLLVGVGSEVKVFTFVDQKGAEYLEPVALHYGFTMACSLDIQDNKILCTQTRNQMYILEYTQSNSQKNLGLVGQYFRELTPLAASFQKNRQIVTDEYKNILIFECLDTSEKLERIGDIHTGLAIYNHCRINDILVMVSQQGAMAALFATDEHFYKKMHTLVNALLQVMPFAAGMNPRGYRLCTMKQRERQRKGVLDLGLIMTYCYLNLSLQHMVARNIGTTRQHILSEIEELQFVHHYLQLILLKNNFLSERYFKQLQL